MTNDKATPDGQRFKVPHILRAPRTLALGALAATVPVATVVAFTLSYRGLVDYGLSVGVPPWLAWAYALMFDLPIIAGEAVLFVAAIDRKATAHVTRWAWLVTIGFAAVSAAGNSGLLPPVAGRALPPVVLAIVLGFGLGELKRHSRRPVPATVTRESRPAKAAAPSTAKRTTGGHLDEVAERRAADAYAELVRQGKQLSERDFANTDACNGNRHRARRAIHAYYDDADPGAVSK